MTVQQQGRKVENLGFYIALGLGTLYGLSEIISHIGITFGTKHDDRFPTGIVTMIVTFCLPKIIGRATAGKIWELLARKKDEA